MDTIFIDSENSETSESHRLLLNLADKINLKRSTNHFALSISQHLLYPEKYKEIIQKQ